MRSVAGVAQLRCEEAENDGGRASGVRKQCLQSVRPGQGRAASRHKLRSDAKKARLVTVKGAAFRGICPHGVRLPPHVTSGLCFRDKPPAQRLNASRPGAVWVERHRAAARRRCIRGACCRRDGDERCAPAPVLAPRLQAAPAVRVPAAAASRVALRAGAVEAALLGKATQRAGLHHRPPPAFLAGRTLRPGHVRHALCSTAPVRHPAPPPRLRARQRRVHVVPAPRAERVSTGAGHTCGGWRLLSRRHAIAASTRAPHDVRRRICIAGAQCLSDGRIHHLGQESQERVSRSPHTAAMVRTLQGQGSPATLGLHGRAAAA